MRLKCLFVGVVVIGGCAEPSGPEALPAIHVLADSVAYTVTTTSVGTAIRFSVNVVVENRGAAALIASGTCEVSLERQTATGWESAWIQACLAVALSPTEIAPDGEYRYQLQVFAGVAGSYGPELAPGPIATRYRLVQPLWMLDVVRNREIAVPASLERSNSFALVGPDVGR